jgi:hypothetical protein
MAEWGELSFKVVRLEQAGQEVLARMCPSRCIKRLKSSYAKARG